MTRIFKFLIVICFVPIWFCNSTSSKESSEKVETKEDIPEMSMDDRLAASGVMNGQEYVDLGLNALWSIKNLGANNIEDYGDYYAWGELSPKYEYKLSNSKTDKQHFEFSISGNPEYDAARNQLGGTWVIPTREDIDELVANCIPEFIVYNSTKGWLLTSKINGKAIFVPATGYRDSSGVEFDKSHSEFWSGTPDQVGVHQSYRLLIKEGHFEGGFWDRRLGLPIRPIANYCSDSEDN